MHAGQPKEHIEFIGFSFWTLVELGPLPQARTVTESVSIIAARAILIFLSDFISACAAKEHNMNYPDVS